MIEEFIPARIIQLRTTKGVSARDMSLTIGQGSGYINNIENKKTLPSIEGLSYICDYFGITPKEFFDDGIQYPEKLKGLITDLMSLNEEQLAAISVVVNTFKK